MKKIIIVILMFLCLCLTGCSNEVSEKEWNKAFSSETFNNCELVGIYGKEGVADSEKIIIKIDGNICYVAEYEVYSDGDSFELDEEVYYYTDSDGVIWEYYYDTDESTWYKELTDVNWGMNIVETSFINYFTDLYYSFEYDKKNDSYVRVDDEIIFTIIFDNEKVSEIKFTNTSENESIFKTSKYKISKYGDIKLKLPKAALAK